MKHSHLPPTLFEVYANEMLREWHNKCSPSGIDIEGEHLHTLSFADYQMLGAADRLNIEYMERKLVEVYEKSCLKIILVIENNSRDIR